MPEARMRILILVKNIPRAQLNALRSCCNKVIDQSRVRCLCLAVPADNYGFEGCVVPIGRQGIRPSSKEDPRMTRGMAVPGLLSSERIEEASVE